MLCLDSSWKGHVVLSPFVHLWSPSVSLSPSSLLNHCPWVWPAEPGPYLAELFFSHVGWGGVGWGGVCGLHGVMLAPDNLPGGNSGPRELGPFGGLRSHEVTPSTGPSCHLGSGPAGWTRLHGRCGLGPLTTVSEPGRAGAAGAWRGTWQALPRCPKRGTDQPGE